MLRALFPPNFFRLLHRQSQALCQEMVALVEFMKSPTPASAAAVFRFEQETARRHDKLMDELRRTPKPPIDPGDIDRLSQTMLEMSTVGKTIVDELTAYRMNPNEILNRMAEGTRAAVAGLSDALDVMWQDHGRPLNQLTRIRERADAVEGCYREGLTVLFKSETIVAQLAYREIYRHFSGVAALAMATATIVGDILVESF